VIVAWGKLITAASTRGCIGKNDELRKRTIDLHEKFSKTKDELNWIVIDSSNQTLDETVGEVYKQL
jgi:hypothetical protein